MQCSFDDEPSLLRHIQAHTERYSFENRELVHFSCFIIRYSENLIEKEYL